MPVNSALSLEALLGAADGDASGPESAEEASPRSDSVDLSMLLGLAGEQEGAAHTPALTSLAASPISLDDVAGREEMGERDGEGDAALVDSLRSLLGGSSAESEPAPSKSKAAPDDWVSGLAALVAGASREFEPAEAGRREDVALMVEAPAALADVAPAAKATAAESFPHAVRSRYADARAFRPAADQASAAKPVFADGPQLATSSARVVDKQGASTKTAEPAGRDAVLAVGSAADSNAVKTVPAPSGELAPAPKPSEPSEPKAALQDAKAAVLSKSVEPAEQARRKEQAKDAKGAKDVKDVKDARGTGSAHYAKPVGASLGASGDLAVLAEGADSASPSGAPAPKPAPASSSGAPAPKPVPAPPSGSAVEAALPVAPSAEDRSPARPVKRRSVRDPSPTARWYVLCAVLLALAVASTCFAVWTSAGTREAPALSSVPASGALTFAYTVQGPDGQPRDVRESVAFGDDGLAESSTLSIQAESDEAAEALLSEAREQFGSSWSGGSVEDGRAAFTVDVRAERIDRKAYEALIMANTADARLLSPGGEA